MLGRVPGRLIRRGFASGLLCLAGWSAVECWAQASASAPGPVPASTSVLAPAPDVNPAAAAQLRQAPDAATVQLAHEIFKQLIEINTTDSVGSTTLAAQAMADRLLAAGFPAEDVHVLGPNARRGNVVARLHGLGAGKPILVICHLDVVEARREDWSTDPFQMVEQNGYFYGRGTQDVKSGDAILIATLIRMKQLGYRPSRDLIVALTADEEGGDSNGVDWLLKNHRELIDAEFVLNPDSGGVEGDHGRAVSVSLGASEKLYADYHILATNPGGHSSVPPADNAIYHLADALEQIAHHPFPIELNAATRAYFERDAPQESALIQREIHALLSGHAAAASIKHLTADPNFNALLRTTCVATRLQAGHANNALPQRAEATVNCRILPGHSKEEVRLALVRMIAQPQLTIRYESDAGVVSDQAPDGHAPPPPPLRADVVQALDEVSHEMWPGVPVIPEMETGASDGIYTNAAGMPTYGVSGVLIDRDDDRAHGRDERLRITAFDAGLDFYGRVLEHLTRSVTVSP